MKGKGIQFVLLAILAITLPILLIDIKQTLDNKSRASSANKLEVEGGTLSSSGVSKK